jgi:hypothetical protein
MSLYAFVLVLHVSAVLVLSAALGIEALSLVHLRSASTPAEVHSWLEAAPRLPRFALGSLLIILSSGIYLVIPSTSSGRAWPKVAVASLFLMAPFGAATARRMRAIRKTLSAANTMNSELLSRLEDPLLKISLSVRISVFLGIFLLVSAKPGLWGAIALLGTGGAVGLLFSMLPWRRGTSFAFGANSR